MISDEDRGFERERRTPEFRRSYRIWSTKAEERQMMLEDLFEDSESTEETDHNRVALEDLGTLNAVRRSSTGYWTLTRIGRALLSLARTGEMP